MNYHVVLLVIFAAIVLGTAVYILIRCIKYGRYAAGISLTHMWDMIWDLLRIIFKILRFILRLFLSSGGSSSGSGGSGGSGRGGGGGMGGGGGRR